MKGWWYLALSMLYQLTEDQEMIRDAVRRFAEAEIQGRAYEWDGAAAAPASVLAALAELGLMGMMVAEDRGGSALDTIGALLAVETLSAADAGLGWTVANHNLMALPVLQAASHATVSALAAGEGVASWFEAPLTVEVEGPQVRLTGVATLVPWGEKARLLAGQVDGPTGPLVVVLSPDADGVRTTPTDGAMGLRSSAQATVRFERSPAERLDLSVAPSTLHAWFRLCRAAVAIGVGKGALDAASRYALEREQFSRPIAQFQAVQWMLAETATEIDAARLLVWSAVDPGGDVRPEAAARASLYALPAATRAGMRAVQVFGGNGYVREYPVERCLRDAKALEVLRAVDADQEAIVEVELEGAGR